MKSVFFETIQNNLKVLGLNRGDALLVHASLGALGKFHDKAQIVTEALLNTVGEEGTLLMPALSYETVTKERPVFNQKHTPSCVGWLSEYFRNQPGVRRSLHPTHSVCALGEKSDYFIDNHLSDHTPCGYYSPFRKLRDIGGKILFLGCSLNANTSMHGVEELVAPEYLYDGEIQYKMELENGDVYQKKYVTHNFKGFQQRYDRVLNILSSDDYSFGKVLTAGTYLIKAIPLWEKSQKKLSDNPLYFVDRMNN